MAEPSSMAMTIASAGISVGAVAFGLNIETVIGALAGATIFVMGEKELGILQRVLYLLASVSVGYFIAPEIIKHTLITEPAVAGFLGGLLTVAGGQVLLRQLQNTDLTWLIKKGGGK